MSLSHNESIQDKRLIMFKIFLSDVQGKPSVDRFSEKFLYQFKCDFKDNKPDKLSVKKYLKSQNMAKHYEDVPFLLNILQGELIFYTKDQEELLCDLFKKISNQYNILYPNESFMSYIYILYKLTEYINHPKLHLINLSVYDNQNFDKKWNEIIKEIN